MPPPTSYRSEIVTPVLAALKAGESCSLIGVGGSGKSNVSRFLVRRDVCREYLGPRAERFLGALVNCTKLSDLSGLSLHRLMLESLHDAASQAGAPADLVDGLNALWMKSLAATAPDLARRALEDAVKLAQRQGIEVLYFVFDDFDRVVTHADPAVLNGLRALRDDNKGGLAYITLTRRELPYLKPERLVEDFIDIVASRTYAIGPYNPADAEHMLQQRLNQYDPPAHLPRPDRLRLLELSGYHASLMRALLIARLEKGADLNGADAPDAALAYGVVAAECAIIWDSLEKPEQVALAALASGAKAAPGGLHRLQQKGLVQSRVQGGEQIFSPVFARFVQRRQPARPGRATFNPATRTVSVDGVSVALPGEVEAQLFALLFEHRPNPVASGRLVDVLWQAERVAGRLGSGPANERLAGTLRALEHALGPLNRNCRIIASDAGWRLTGLD